jgi:hypothetical protein
MKIKVRFYWQDRDHWGFYPLEDTRYEGAPFVRVIESELETIEEMSFLIAQMIMEGIIK